MHRLREQCRHKLRLQWNCEPFSFLKTKTEVSMVFNKGPDQGHWNKGILMYQDLAFNCRKPQLSFHLRLAYFDTDRYDLYVVGSDTVWDIRQLSAASRCRG